MCSYRGLQATLNWGTATYVWLRCHAVHTLVLEITRIWLDFTTVPFDHCKLRLTCWAVHIRIHPHTINELHSRYHDEQPVTKKQSHHPRHIFNSKSAFPTNAEFKNVLNCSVLTEPYTFRALHRCWKRQNCSYHCSPCSHFPCLTGLPTRHNYSYTTSLSRRAKIQFKLRQALLTAVSVG